MDFGFNRRAYQVLELSRKKWECRKLKKIPCNPYQNYTTRKNSVVWPKELQIPLNLKAALCPKCKVPCGDYHMLTHNIFIPTDTVLLSKIIEINKDYRKGRIFLLKTACEYIKPFIDVLTLHLNCKH